MAEKKSPTKEIDESNDSDQDIIKIIDELDTDAQKHVAENAERFLEDFELMEDLGDSDMLMKNLQSFFEDMKKAEKRALSDEQEENLTSEEKRQKIDYFNIEDETTQVTGGTKNKKNSSSNAYDSLTPEKNSSMAQDPFNPKHVPTCSDTEEPATSHPSSGQLPQPPTTPSSSQAQYNPKLVQTSPLPNKPITTTSSLSTQPPQPPATASTSQGTCSVSSPR